MINTSIISNSIIQEFIKEQKHTALFCIKSLCDWIQSESLVISKNINNYNISKRIKSLSADKLNLISKHPSLQLWFSNIIRRIRHKEEIKDEIFLEGLHLIESVLNIPISGDEIINKSHNYIQIVDHSDYKKSMIGDRIVMEKQKSQTICCPAEFACPPSSLPNLQYFLK